MKAKFIIPIVLDTDDLLVKATATLTRTVAIHGHPLVAVTHYGALSLHETEPSFDAECARLQSLGYEIRRV